MYDFENWGFEKVDVVVGRCCVVGRYVVWKVMYHSFSMEGRHDDDDGGDCVVLVLVLVSVGSQSESGFRYSRRKACVITERVSASRAWT